MKALPGHFGGSSFKKPQTFPLAHRLILSILDAKLHVLFDLTHKGFGFLVYFLEKSHTVLRFEQHDREQLHECGRVPLFTLNDHFPQQLLIELLFLLEMREDGHLETDESCSVDTRIFPNGG